MKVSENGTQSIVNNNKIQYKQANLITIQSTMFERGKFDVNGVCVNLPLTHI